MQPTTSPLSILFPFWPVILLIWTTCLLEYKLNESRGFFYSFLPPAMSPDLNVRCFKIFFNEWLQKQMSKNIHCPFFSKWLFKTMKHNQVPSVHASNHVLQSAYSCEREHPQSEWSQAHLSTLPSQSRVKPAGNIRSRPLKGLWWA